MRFILVGDLGQDDDQGGGQQDEPAEDLGEGVLDLDLHGGGVLRRRRSLRLLKKMGGIPRILRDVGYGPDVAVQMRRTPARGGRPGCDLGFVERPAPGACTTSGAVVGVDALGLIIAIFLYLS